MFPFFLAVLAGMFGCHGSGDILSQSLNESEQVAVLKTVNNHQVVVCDFELLKDTVAVPLSYLTEELHIVRLDNRPDAYVPVSDVSVGDHCLLVGGDYWNGKVPHKLFDRSGSFITDVGGFGRGPGEYFTSIFSQQLDEKNNRIYLLPWRSDRILVYDLKGNPLDPIRLPCRIHIGRFRVNQEDSIVSVFVAPVNDRRTNTQPTVHFAWSQDMSGKFLKGLSLSPEYLSVFDMTRFEANYPHSFGNVREQDVYTATPINPRQDTLYHYDVQNNRLIPRFTIDFKGGKIPVVRLYCELPNHYIGRFAEPKEVARGMFRTVNCKYFLIDKTTLKGSYIKLENDFLGNMDIAAIKDPAGSFWNGYYVNNYDPAYLLEGLENTLAGKKMSAEMRKKLTELKNSMKETDNNYILYAKLKQ
jgi:hypothetical protein